ncbi:MAG: 5'-3' exonuclease H3TH domain-containing protein [Candidatus Dormiibacterota bacterium]
MAWLLVDGSSLIFRAFFGVPKAMRAPDGSLNNAIRGFQDTLARIVAARQPDHLAIATDEDWRPKWRVDLIPSYKSHRTAEPVPPELEPQLPKIESVLAAIGVDMQGLPQFEAEDVIASWARQIDGEVWILSGDRDLFGLVEDGRVRVLYPEKGGLAEITEAEIERRYGVPGRAYADFAVLRGDPSDGLPGVGGIGAKRAAELVSRYGGIEGIVAAGRLGAADADYVTRAIQVVRPAPGDLPLPPGRRDDYPLDQAALATLVERYGLGGSAERLLNALRSVLGR